MLNTDWMLNEYMNQWMNQGTIGYQFRWCIPWTFGLPKHLKYKLSQRQTDDFSQAIIVYLRNTRETHKNY